MKILLVSSATPEHRIVGGIVSHLALLKRHLQERGNEVHTLAAAPATVAGRKSCADVTPVRPHLIDGVPIRYHLNLLSAYAELSASFAPDVIHIHSQSGVAIALKERRTPVVTTVHASESPDAESDAVGFARIHRIAERSVKRRLVGALLRCSDQVFVPSPKTARDLLGFCPGLHQYELEVLPIGVDRNRFRPLADTEQLKADLGFGGQFVLLFVGRLTRKKGVDDLLRAAESVLAAIPTVVFVIVGTGPAEKELKREAGRLELGDQFVFVGAVPNRHLPSYYNAADVFINPTRENETFGLTTIEALACGLPVVISSIGADTGTVTSEHAVMFDSPDDLSSRLKALYEDPDLREKLSVRGRRRSEVFAFAPVVERLERCYEELSASGKTPAASNADRQWGSFWCASMADGLLRWPRRVHHRVSAGRKGRTE